MDVFIPHIDVAFHNMNGSWKGERSIWCIQTGVMKAKDPDHQWASQGVPTLFFGKKRKMKKSSIQQITFAPILGKSTKRFV